MGSMKNAWVRCEQRRTKDALAAELVRCYVERHTFGPGPIAVGDGQRTAEELLQEAFSDRPPLQASITERESTCETDKPEGTRDPDKFLKEQQDRLWEGVV